MKRLAEVLKTNEAPFVWTFTPQEAARVKAITSKVDKLLSAVKYDKVDKALVKEIYGNLVAAVDLVKPFRD